MTIRWPLTGRGEELRLISEALADESCNGMLIAGLAGVGKTRLARAATDDAARAGWAVRRIAGTATGRAVTLGAFARWATDTAGSPVSLARDVFAGLTADVGGKPLMLFVDDAHLLDEMSALIVHQLVLQEVADVIATVRTGEPAPDAVTTLWKDGLLQRLELQPLSRRESGELLAKALEANVTRECTDRMWSLSRGNVLFLHHLVEHELDSGQLALVDGLWSWQGTPSVSPSLVELVETQIGAVPDAVRDVVDLVAIAEPIDRSLLTHLTDAHAIETAEERGLIACTPATDTVFVGHPLYGEIRLGQCGPMRLRRLRGRVATAMADAGGADPLRLGLLWLESDLAPDVPTLAAAADISSSRLDLALAERLSRACVDASPSPATKFQLAYILYLREKGEAAEELLNSLSPQELAATGFVNGVILRAANLLWPLRNPEASRAVIDDALALGDATLEQALLTFRAIGEAMAAQPARTVQTMAGVDYGRLDSYGRILGYAAETIGLGDLGRLAQADDRATAGYRVLAESPQDSFQASGLAEFHAYACLAAGRVAEASTIVEQSYEHSADLPGLSQSMSIAALGMAALGRGDLRTAREHLDSARHMFGDYGEVAGLFYRFRILRTEVLARLGERDAATASLQATRESRHPAYLYVESDYLRAYAWVEAVAGRVDQAREIISQAVQFARSHGQPARELWCLQTAAQFGDTTGVSRLDVLAAELEGPRAPLAARYSRALADGDADGLDVVSRDFETMGDMLAAADAAAQASVCHSVAGSRGEAFTASARAGLLAQTCGDAVSPALSTGREPLPFTRREHEIATLLAEGLSNRAIAKAMSLSVRTVEGHIYQASIKAGMSSRAELSALVQQFNRLQVAPAE